MVTVNSKGVVSGEELGCGDFMSGALYNTAVNSFFRTNNNAANLPINPPNNPISSTDEVAIKEHYVMYKKFGGEIDFGSFTIRPEYGTDARSGTFKGVWVAPYPYFDSTESVNTVLAKAYFGSSYVYSEKTFDEDDTSVSILSVWMYLGAAGWVNTLSVSYTHLTLPTIYSV